jgi:hypothetical protein
LIKKYYLDSYKKIARIHYFYDSFIFLFILFKIKFTFFIREGKGKEFYASGASYEGDFKNGLK